MQVVFFRVFVYNRICPSVMINYSSGRATNPGINKCLCLALIRRRIFVKTGHWSTNLVSKRKNPRDHFQKISIKIIRTFLKNHVRCFPAGFSSFDSLVSTVVSVAPAGGSTSDFRGVCSVSSTFSASVAIFGVH